MTKISNKITTDLDEVSQSIDIEKEFGVDPPDDIKQAIAQDLIDVIKERTINARDIRGESLTSKTPYSKSYKNSETFDAYDKTNKVNMQLTGDMLESIDVLDTSDGIKIGIAGDQAPKAYNHQTGDTLPKREFFGVTDEEVKRVADRYRDDLKSDDPLTASTILKQLEQFGETRQSETRTRNLMRLFFPELLDE